MNTRHIGAGSYPEVPEQDYRTYKVECSFTGYVSVPVKKFDNEDEEFEYIKDYIESLTDGELMEDTDKVVVENWERT